MKKLFVVYALLIALALLMAGWGVVDDTPDLVLGGMGLGWLGTVWILGTWGYKLVRGRV